MTCFICLVMANNANTNNANKPNRNRVMWTLPVGFILTAWSGAFAYAAWRQRIQRNDLTNAAEPKVCLVLICDGNSSLLA